MQSRRAISPPFRHLSHPFTFCLSLRRDAVLRRLLLNGGQTWEFLEESRTQLSLEESVALSLLSTLLLVTRQARHISRVARAGGRAR